MIVCRAEKSIELQVFGEAKTTIEFDRAPSGTALTGHGGADFFLARAFFK